MEELKKISITMNGERVEKTLYRRQNGFDGQTGQPITEEVVQNGFDSQSGEPLYASVEQDGFDGQTGEPVYKVKGAQPQAGMISPAMNPALGKKSSKKLPLIIGCVVAAVAVICIAAFALIKSGFFLSKQEKIMMATQKTLEEDTFTGTLIQAQDMLKGNQSTVNMNMNFGESGINVGLSGSLACDGDTGKFMFDGSGSALGVSQSVKLYYDESRIQFAMPDASSTVFQYDYTADNKGFIADLVAQQPDVTLEEINNILALYGEMMRKGEEFNEKVNANLNEELKKIEVEDAESKEIEIDGNKKNCDGYTIHLTKDTVEGLLDAYEKAQEEVFGDSYKNMEKTMEKIQNSAGAEGSSLNTMDMLKDLVKDMEDTDMNIYLYDGKLAGIDFDKVKIEFNGGDTRTSNLRIDVDSDGEEVSVTKTSSISGNREEGAIESSNGTSLKYSYDMDNGEYRIDSEGEVFTGTFLAKDEKLTIDFKGNVDGSDINAEMIFVKGAKVDELQGEIFDVGNASEADMENEIMKITQALTGGLF